MPSAIGCFQSLPTESPIDRKVLNARTDGVLHCILAWIRRLPTPGISHLTIGNAILLAKYQLIMEKLRGYTAYVCLRCTVTAK